MDIHQGKPNTNGGYSLKGKPYSGNASWRNPNPMVEMHSGETQTLMVEYTNQDTQIDNMSDASTEYDPSIIEFLNLGNQYNFNKRIEEFKN